MRRIITLVVAALAMAGCSMPTAPADDASAEAAKSVLKGASKVPAKASTRLASN